MGEFSLVQVLVQRHLAEKPDKHKRGKRKISSKKYSLLFYLGFKSDRSLRLSQISATDPNVEEYWFVCRQWFDKGAGDRQTIRELLPTDPDGKPLSDRNGKYIKYSIVY